MSVPKTDPKVRSLGNSFVKDLGLLTNPAAFLDRVTTLLNEGLGIHHCRFIPTTGRDAAVPAAAAGEICIPVIASDQRTVGYLVAFPARSGKAAELAAVRLGQAARMLAGPFEVALTVNSMRETLSSDELTGLYTQRLFRRRLLEETARAKRHGRVFAIGLVDINQLGVFNDLAGWAAGDEVLINLSNALATSLRASDLVARLGGDEFGVIMVETGKPGGMACLKRALEDFSGRCLLVHGEVYAVPDVSYGVSSFPADGEDPVHLLAVAARRMVQRQTRAVGRSSSGSNRVIQLAPRQGE